MEWVVILPQGLGFSPRDRVHPATLGEYAGERAIDRIAQGLPVSGRPESARRAGRLAQTPGRARRIHGTPDAIQAVAPTGPEKPVTARVYDKPRRDSPLRFPIGKNLLYPLESRSWIQLL